MMMKNYCGQSVTLQNTLRFMQRLFQGSSTMERSHRFELVDVYAFPDSPFSNGLRNRHDIIRTAWDRLCREKAYAI